MSNAIAIEVIATRILELRGKKVMLDRDLAKLYRVPAKVLNQAVKRNIKRFPEDFMFRLSWKEVESLRSQFVTLNNIKPKAFSLILIPASKNINTQKPILFNKARPLCRI